MENQIQNTEKPVDSRIAELQSIASCSSWARVYLEPRAKDIYVNSQHAQGNAKQVT